MEISKKMNNYLCTRCKYKHNSLVPCASCDGVSEFVEQSRSKYNDGLYSYVQRQEWLSDKDNDKCEIKYVSNNEKEKEMSKKVEKKDMYMQFRNIGVSIKDSVYASPSEIFIEGDIIYLNSGLFSGEEIRAEILRRLNNNSSGYGLPEIKNVIFNEPATIVFWADGTKTVVKCQEGDIFDPEKGLTMAITKKALGNKGSYYNEIGMWCERYYEKPDAKEVTITFEGCNFLDGLKRAFRATNAVIAESDKKEDADGK